MPKKIVSDPTQDETPQPTKKERINEPVTEFKAKLNKWGFIHVPKRTAPSLPFKIENPLMARIEDETLVIATTTKNQPKKAKARRKPMVVNVGGDTDYSYPKHFFVKNVHFSIGLNKKISPIDQL